jgi:hypothetical protein
MQIVALSTLRHALPRTLSGTLSVCVCVSDDGAWFFAYSEEHNVYSLFFVLDRWQLTGAAGRAANGISAEFPVHRERQA